MTVMPNNLSINQLFNFIHIAEDNSTKYIPDATTLTNCFEEAIKNNRIDILRILYSHDPSIATSDSLFMACQYSSRNIVKYLINTCKLDIHAENSYGVSCFRNAMRCKRADILKLLYSIDKNICEKNWSANYYEQILIECCKSKEEGAQDIKEFIFDCCTFRFNHYQRLKEEGEPTDSAYSEFDQYSLAYSESDSQESEFLLQPDN